MAEPTRKTPLKDAPAPKAKRPAASSRKTGPGAAFPAPQPKPSALAPPIPGKGADETDDFAEIITRPVVGAWDFLKTGCLPAYLSLLKLNLVRNVLYFLSLAVLFGILLGIVLALAGYAAASPLVFWSAMLILMLAGFVLILWMVQTFESAAYLLIAQKIAAKPYSMMSALGSARGPTLRYAFLDLGLRLLVMIPGLLLLLLPFGVQMGTGSSAFLAPGLALAYFTFLIYYFFANLIYEFLVQFWRYGFLFEGLGVVASLKRSYSLIRSRPIETFVFNLVYVVAFIAFSIPSFVFGIVAYFVLLIVQLASLMALGMWGYVVYFAVALLLAIAGIVFSSIMETACRPLHYLFWKGVTDRAKK